MEFTTNGAAADVVLDGDPEDRPHVPTSVGCKAVRINSNGTTNVKAGAGVFRGWLVHAAGTSSNTLKVVIDGVDMTPAMTTATWTVGQLFAWPPTMFATSLDVVTATDTCCDVVAFYD